MGQGFASIPLGPDIVTALQRGLPHFKSAEGLEQVLLDAAKLEGNSWQVFTLTLPDVLERGFRAITVSAGWRIAARSGNQVIAADIYTGDTLQRVHPFPLEAGAPRLACIRRNEEISKMLDTIQQLSNPPAPSYIHILLLPGLVTDALWIKPQDPSAGEGTVVPFNTMVEGLRERNYYDQTSFLQRVQPLARKFERFRREPLSIEEQFAELGIKQKDRLSVRRAQGKQDPNK